MANSLRMKLRAGAPKDPTIQSPSSSYKTWFKPSGTIERFVPKDPGVYQFDVIPWMGADGQAHDLMYAWVHRSVGPEKADYLCLGRDKCPACAEAERLDETNHDAALQLFSKERVLMIVRPIGPHGPGPLMFFETAARGKTSFITHLKAAQDVQVKKTWIADPDVGPTLSVLFQKADFNGHTFLEIGRVDLVPRQYEVTDDVLNSCPNPETWKVRATAAEIEAALYGAAPEEPNQDSQQESYRSRPQTSASVNEDVNTPINVHQHFHSAAPENTAPERTLVTPQGQSFSDPFPDQPTDMQAAPTQQAAPIQQAAPVQAAPVGTASGVASTSGDVCPKGYRFGQDCDALPLCSRCPDPMYEKCKRAMKR